LVHAVNLRLLAVNLSPAASGDFREGMNDADNAP